MMIAFCADLDNTMIYSYRHDIGRDKRCVEIYEGRQVSFMTERTAQLLAELPSCTLFVPTTTRTVEQYGRIEFPTGAPPYALVCNGGVLLVDGVECPEWYAQSRRLVDGCRSQLRVAQQMLARDPDVDFEVRFIRELFIFTKSAQPEQTLGRLRSVLNPDAVDLFRNGKKVYVVPKQMNKGRAVTRLRERIGVDYVIAAGDSEFDIPMLRSADCPIAPGELAKSSDLPARTYVMEENGVFAEYALEHVLRQSGSVVSRRRMEEKMESGTNGSRKERAMQNFLMGYNCTQSILLAFEDVLPEESREEIIRMSSAFGGGMGRLREVCGSVSGMFLVAGLLYGYSGPETGERKAELYSKIQQLAHEFEEQNGSIVCRELLGLSVKEQEPVPEARTKEYYKKRPCKELIGMSAEILENFMRDMEND